MTKLKCVAALSIAMLSPMAASAQNSVPSAESAESVAPPEDIDEIALPTLDELALSRDRATRYTLPVGINGTGPYTFMVDTGAQATVLSRALADRLDLGERTPAVLVGMSSRRQTETVAIDALTFGSRTVPIRSAPLVASANLGRIDGILGLDSLQGQRVLLDFSEGTIAVDDAEALGGNSGYEITVRARARLGQLIITSARVNGIRTAVIIDTGAQGSMGNRALERRLPGRTLGYQWLEDINGVMEVNPMRRIRQLDIGLVRLTNVPMAFSDAEPFAVLGLDRRPAIILGLSELRQFDRVAIDFDSGKIYFDMPEGTPLREIFGRR